MVLDVSHGGSDDGAINKTLDLKEKDLILAICKKLKKIGKSSKVKYVLTRKKDTHLNLHERIKIINHVDADLMITLHMNESGDTNRSGAEIHYFDEESDSDQSKAFCEVAKKSLELNGGSFEIRNTEYKILNDTYCPSTFLQLGYITNTSEAVYMSSTPGQLEIAAQIDKAVVTFRDRNLTVAYESSESTN